MKSREILCYCAFCKNPRRMYRKRTLGFLNIIQAFGIAALLSYIIWQKPDPRGLVIWVMTLMCIEIFILIRSRAEIACSHCGFDPAIYSRNKERACELVKLHIASRQNDPDVWLARKPPLRIHRRKKKNSTREIVV